MTMTMLKRFTSISEVEIRDNLPKRRDFSPESILVYDQYLTRYKFFRHWLSQFKVRLPVKSGEGLKSLENFSRLVKTINQKCRSYSRSEMQIVSVGGGTVGDVTGFIASVLKRGVQHIQIPSTWLAAIDSAHGGKNGINIQGAKNQLGTFYPAAKVIVVKELLWPQPHERALEALSEVLKIGFIKGGRWMTVIKRQVPRVLATPTVIEVKGQPGINLRDEAVRELIWENIPYAIKSKGSIVRVDPYEKRGHRRVLNLGHTLGHIFETFYGWPHGLAVAEGLRFSIEWSRQKKFLKDDEAAEIIFDILSVLPRGTVQKRIPKKQFLHTLSQDKKATGRNKIAFIFVKGLGRPFIKVVSASEIQKEAERQGWTT
jgi:3-dehydroquinate synthase